MVRKPRNRRLRLRDIEAEHDLLLGVVRALGIAVNAGKPEQIEPLLSQLAELTRVHFATEDIMMRLHAYPEFAAHQLDHARLVEQVEHLRAEYALGHVQPTRAFATALRHWFTEHVRSRDSELASFVRSIPRTTAP
jgi:hemerythrin